MMKNFLNVIILFASLSLFAQSPTCEGASAICSGAVAPFPNTTGVSSIGGPDCLGSAPNPAWFFFRIGESGTLNFTINQGNNPPNYNNQDVDFIVWGPFSSAPNCTDLWDYSPGATVDNVVDCSYLPDDVEFMSIPNAIAGQYYMLLVTNYQNQPGFIELNQTNLGQPGAGSTDCNIVCGVDLGEDRFICGGVNSIDITAIFNQAPTLPGTPTYEWFLNGSTTPFTTTTTNTITVTASGTYSVSVVRPGCSDVATDEVEVQFVGSVPFNYVDPVEYCNETIDLTSFESDIVAPEDPSSYTFVYYDENGVVIPDPTVFNPSGYALVEVKVSTGPCFIVDVMEFYEVCPTCTIDLSSAIGTDDQTICIGGAIDNIEYITGADVTNAMVTNVADLPAD